MFAPRSACAKRRAIESGANVDRSSWQCKAGIRQNVDVS